MGVDCGGPCANACNDGSSATAAATTCNTLHTLYPAKTSGVYWINPSGGSSSNAFQAYCDMTSNGGGWTLILRTANDATFAYASAYWTNQTALNPTDFTPTTNVNAKYPSYWQVPGTVLRGCAGAATGCQLMTFGGTRTAYSLFTGAAVVSTTNGTYISRSSIVAAFPPDCPVEPNCNANGTNLTFGTYDSLRFGLAGNNENECVSPDVAWGFGISSGCGGNCGAGSATMTSVTCGAQVTTCAQATLWIR
jgi:hypothetical protein